MPTPLLVERGAAGHDPADPAVRRFWSAVIGPSAVADLLRLTAAARQQRRIREPVRLAQLAAEGLVDRSRDLVLVRPRIPFLGPSHVRRLSPALRAEYATVRQARRSQ
jgi:hypothetical protein